MLVYGDRALTRDPRGLIAELDSNLRRLTATPRGIERHGALVSPFVAASELAQGVADAAFEAAGWDDRSPEQDAAMALLMGLAQVVTASWDGGSPGSGEVALARKHLAALSELHLPPAVTIKQAEGYAFYALYPEAYAEAARSIAPAPRTRVVGLRSIATGLSAMVAAVLRAPAPITLRPVGPPFQRALRLSPKLREELLSDPAARFALVDEGPGLSGSSLGAVADLLEDNGVTREQIVFFPGHGGDLGPQASERHRRRWRMADRRVVDFDTLVSPERLASWAEPLIGAPIEAVQDLSGGAWRALRYAHEADWPPANTLQERRKFLVRTASGAWLLKFVGLGAAGDSAFRRAKMLADAGLAPGVVAMRHGFLVERWVEGACPLKPSAVDRPRLIRHLARYLGFRARRLPAEPGSGASIEDLFEMIRVNASEALGPIQDGRLDALRGGLAGLADQLRRVETDNRMQAWEWIETGDGAWLKTDAVDHAHAHDLIGCQDIGYDVAGASVEFGLDAHERESLRRAVEAQGKRLISPELIDFYVVAYAAFQLGAYEMATQAHAHWPAEQSRLANRRDSYASALKRVLDGQPA